MKILVTGGTGLVGSTLIPKLIDKGYLVNILSRKSHVSKNSQVSYYTWDIKKEYLDPKALDGVDIIIHLAGAGIADKIWTPQRKKLLIDSRVKSLELIYKAIENGDHKPKKLISTSGIGYYGAVTTDTIFTEKDPPGNDFVSQICIEWENAALAFEQLGIKVFIPRVGVVFSKKGGALDRMKTPIKFNIGSPLGSGKQWMPWIHINDLCSIYLKAVKDIPFVGTYNAIAEQHLQNKEFSKTLAKVMGKAHFMPNVPSFILKMLFGEMATLILEGSRASNTKIKEAGIEFRYYELKSALKSLLR